MNSFPLNLGIIDLPKEIISRIAEYPFYPFRKLKSTRDAFYRTDSASDNFSDQPDPNVPPTPYQVTFDSELVGDPKTNLYREELFVNEDFVLPLNPGGTVFSRKRVARLKESNSKPGGKHPTKSPPSSDKKEAEETFNILNDLSDILKCESTQYSNNDPSMGEPYSKSQSFNNSHRKTDSAVELQIDDSCSTTSSSSYSSSSTSTSTSSSRLSFPPFSSYSPFRIMKYLPLPIPSSRWQPQPTPSPSSAFQTTPQHSHESLHIETRTPLLFIHGFVQNRFAFGAPTNIRPTSILSYLASHGYDVFYFDLRGSRDSIRLGCELPRTLMEYVTHDIPAALSFLRRIRKEEKRKKGVEYDEAEKVVLVGFSMGCILASAYAGINPQDVLGIIQIAGLYEARDSPSIFHNAIGRIVKSIPSVLDPFRLPYHFMLSSIPQLKKLLDNPVNPIAAWLPRSLEPDVLHVYLEKSVEITSIGVFKHVVFLNYLAESLFEAALDKFESLDLPLLVICSSSDSIIPYHTSLECYHRSRSTKKSCILYDEFNLVSYSHLFKSRDELYSVLRGMHKKLLGVEDSVFFRPDGVKVDRSVSFGHTDILIGQKSMKYVWEPIRQWLDDRFHKEDKLVGRIPKEEDVDLSMGMDEDVIMTEAGDTIETIDTQQVVLEESQEKVHAANQFVASWMNSQSEWDLDLVELDF